MVRTVVFDIDNTLTDDVSWLRITELLGASVAAHRSIFERFRSGELPYSEAKRRLIALWRATGKTQKDHWQSLFAEWPLRPEAAPIVRSAQSRGYQVALITGSIDLFAEAVAAKLGIAHWYANTATHWGPRGGLSDFTYVADQAGQKLIHLKQFAVDAGVDIAECIAVGDGENDVQIFAATGHGIAVGDVGGPLRAVAWKHAKTLADVAAYIKKPAV